jgi:mannose-6-phosphate isomerase-like protein (cupin superfamily)
MSRIIHLGGMTVTFLKTRHEADGSLDAFEVTIPPQIGIIVPHLHHSYDETVLGVDGTTRWTVAGQTTHLGPGQKLEIPRGAPHAVANPRGQSARFICIHTPGVVGPEYFDELAEAMAHEGQTDYAALGTIMTRYGVIPAQL